MSLHPIMREYLNTMEPLFQIIATFANKNQLLEETLKAIVQNMHKKELNQKLLDSIDNAIIKGHPDQNIFSLFISCAVEYMCYFDQFEKAHALCAIGQNLSYDKIHPRVKAYFYVARTRLCRSEGNMLEAMSHIKESMVLVPKSDTRHLLFLGHFSILLAAQGQLKDKGKYNLKGLQAITTGIELFGALEAKIINCIHIAEDQEGFQFLNEYKNKSEEEIPYRFTIFNDLLKIVSGDFNEPSYSEPHFKYFAKCLHSLSEGKVEEAVKFHQQFLACIWPKMQMQQFSNNLPIHFELCLGNKGMARFLLQEKHNKGDVHYLDDLFLGRIQLLEKDRFGANVSFARLFESVSKFGAINRLKFELQFAKEMKLPDILGLINGDFKLPKNVNSDSIADDLAKFNTTEKGINIFVGKSQVMMEVKELIKKYAQIKNIILVTGETGTGKELVAQALHEEGPHAKESFLAINCGALTDSLLQSELFGYVKGAFTGAQNEHKGIFESAGLGTVFLDEFGNISPTLQVTLLRVLESNEIRMIGATKTKKINCKIVIATNIDLQNAVNTKEFREDLYYRLARFEIKLPLLRDRKEDIPELTQHFLSLCSRDDGKQKNITSELQTALVNYPWPGNIRELKNQIEKMCILNPNTNTLELSHFNQPITLVVDTKESKLATKEKSKKSELDEQTIQEILKKGFPIEQRQIKLKELFQKYKKLTKGQIMELTSVSGTTATKDLQALQDSGSIVRRSPTKSSRTDYFEFIEK